MTITELEAAVIEWSKARKIVPNSSSAVQTLKAMSEMGELADAVLKGNRAGVVDGIGDVMVCLINVAALQGLTLTECLAAAYAEIAPRRGTLLPNGVFVKDE